MKKKLIIVGALAVILVIILCGILASKKDAGSTDHSIMNNTESAAPAAEKSDSIAADSGSKAEQGNFDELSVVDSIVIEYDEEEGIEEVGG